MLVSYFSHIPARVTCSSYCPSPWKQIFQKLCKVKDDEKIEQMRILWLPDKEELCWEIGTSELSGKNDIWHHSSWYFAQYDRRYACAEQKQICARMFDDLALCHGVQLPSICVCYPCAPPLPLRIVSHPLHQCPSDMRLPNTPLSHQEILKLCGKSSE